MSGFGSYRNSPGSSHHYSHPYAPNGEPSQPLRAGVVAYVQSEEDHGEAQFRHHSETSSLPSRSSASIHGGQDYGPIPAPIIRSQYAEPVFQTFKERKRAKEEAMRAQAGDHGTFTPRSSSTFIASEPHQDFALPSDRPDIAINGPPRPGVVYPTPAPPSSSYSVVPPSRDNGTPDQSHWSPAAPRPAIPPPVRLSCTRPLPSPVRTENVVEPGPSSPRATRSDPTGAQAAMLDRSDTVSSVKSLDRESGFGSPTKRPLPKPPVAVNSSKSLDRGIPSGIGGMGKSTLIGPAEGYSKTSGRKLPSTVTEVSEGSADEHSPVLPRAGYTQVPPSERPTSPLKRLPSPRLPMPVPAIPAIVIASTDYDTSPDIIPIVSMPPVVRCSPPVIIEPQSTHPATFTALPSITIGDSDEDETLLPNTGIAFSGLPVIAVSSGDASDDLPVHLSKFSDDMASQNSRAESSLPPTSRMTHIDPSAAIICAGCSNPIIGRIVRAMDQRWHPQCFTCGECGEFLEHVSSYEFNRKPYCHLDYHDKFAHRCHHCKTPIVEPRFITLDDPVLGQRYYHELHFFCSECGDPFLDPSKSSAPGTERSRPNQPEEEETNAFVIQKGHPYCERCHLRLHKPKCKGCRLPIPDMALDAMGGKWHQECFVCAECGNGFANSLFFPRDGKAFCTECYSLSVL